VAVVRDHVLSIGSAFEGRYDILAPLGEGSFGRVYKGRQRSTGQAVAITPVLERATRLVALTTDQQIPTLEGPAYVFRGWALRPSDRQAASRS